MRNELLEIAPVVTERPAAGTGTPRIVSPAHAVKEDTSLRGGPNLDDTLLDVDIFAPITELIRSFWLVRALLALG